MPQKKTRTTTKKWSADVMEHTDALDLKHELFKGSSKEIAHGLKLSAQKSTRRKGTPFQSAMSMLNFYINRAGKNLSEAIKIVWKKQRMNFGWSSGKSPRMNNHGAENKGFEQRKNTETSR